MEKYGPKKDGGIIFSKEELYCLWGASNILEKADSIASQCSGTMPLIDLRDLNLMLDRLCDYIDANDGKLPFNSEY